MVITSVTEFLPLKITKAHLNYWGHYWSIPPFPLYCSQYYPSRAEMTYTFWKTRKCVNIMHTGKKNKNLMCISLQNSSIAQRKVTVQNKKILSNSGNAWPKHPVFLGFLKRSPVPCKVLWKVLSLALILYFIIYPRACVYS